MISDKILVKWQIQWRTAKFDFSRNSTIIFQIFTQEENKKDLNLFQIRKRQPVWRNRKTLFSNEADPSLLKILKNNTTFLSEL